ncbi:MAG: hypothetical protein JXL97_10395 [Bacteroidales bacterium]|nr:hypothetical protein [Bacteroidales bacterium]
MKKLTVITILFIVIFTFGCKTGQNNNGENINTEIVEEEYFFPEELTYNQSVSEVLVNKFYPIGWSKDGNFAYITEPADEGLGNYMVGVVIVNLVSDEILWSWYTDPVVDEDLYREDIWKKHYDDFKENLNKYGIIQVRKIKMEDTYFSYEKNDYVVRVETKTEEDPDLNIDLIMGCDIFIKSPQLGEKKIASVEYEQSLILGQQISGCLISPFEDRIVVIIKNERWGYEGPPDVVEFEIYGSNLTTGFQQQ